MVQTLMAVCQVILRGQQIYNVIQAVHWLLYVVAKCHFFSVVPWKDIQKIFAEMWGLYSLLLDTVFQEDVHEDMLCALFLPKNTTAA